MLLLDRRVRGLHNRTMPRQFTDEQKAHKADYLKAWRLANPAKTKAASDRAYAKARVDPVAIAKNRANVAAHARATPERVNAANQKWRRQHPEQAAAIGKANCANRRAAPGKLTTAEVQMLRAAADSVCAYCLQLCVKPVLEHVIPISRGGTNTPDNIVMACQWCNNSKGTKTPLEFLAGWPRVPEKYLTA